MPKEHALLKYWRLFYPLGLYFIVSYIIAFIGVLGIGITSVIQNPDLPIEDLMQVLLDRSINKALLLTFLSALCTLPFLILFMRMDKEKKKKAGTFKTYEPVPLLGYGIIIILGCFACIGLNNLMQLSGLMERFGSGYDEIIEALYQSNILFEILATGIVIPVVEEFLFRGLIYSRAREYFSFPVALVISAMIFGTFHGNMVQGIYAFILGLIMAYVYEKFKSIWAPVLIHISANSISVILTETEIFDPIFENHVPFLFLTGVSIIIVTCMLLLIEQKINPKEVEA